MSRHLEQRFSPENRGLLRETEAVRRGREKTREARPRGFHITILCESGFLDGCASYNGLSTSSGDNVIGVCVPLNVPSPSKAQSSGECGRIIRIRSVGPRFTLQLQPRLAAASLS